VSQPTAAPVAQPTAVPAPAKPKWPEPGKAITVVVPWAAASGSDVLARVLGLFMEKELGAPMQVVNKPGAATQLGMTDVAKAKGDGYTVAVNTAEVIPLIYHDPERKAAFGSKDFTPLAVTSLEPYGLVVKGDSPYKTVKDLVDAAKAKPDSIKIGDNGYMSNPYVALVLLEKAAGVRFAPVHFDSTGASVTALLGGHVDASIVSAAGLMGNFKSGALRSIGVFGREQVDALFPGAKPLPAQGYNAIQYMSKGYIGPAGIPADVVDVFTSAVKRTIDNPEFKKKAEESSILAKYMGPAEFGKYWIEMDAEMKNVLDEIRKSQRQ
jgi:tripartite-type tricarboxylate transporter receptor subunit TctC